MRILTSLFFFLFSLSIVHAQVTYADNIAPIIYKNCSNCHRPGEIGPFPMTTYDEVSSWGNMIKYVTETKYMPPWKPDPNYSHFLEESYLTDEEISMIAEWVDAGMPRGDVGAEPDFPEYPTGSLLGEPDLVLTMEEAHLHKGNNRDSYYYFVLPTGLTEDKIIKSVEFRPGNSKIVHHALIFEDIDGIARATDATTPEYGFESFGSFNGDENDINFLFGKQFPPYAPGQKAIRYQDGLGQVMRAGADLAVQVHYAPSSTDELDKSSINIFFADANEPVDRYVRQNIFLPLQLPGGFFGFVMSPNQISTFEGSMKMNQDISMMGIFPHSHLLGKEWEAWVDHTDGSRTNLISIPEWDFNWQSQYYFDRLIKVEKDAVIRARAVYDNTVDNPNNPFNPPRTIFWGDRTQDEMYYMPFLFVPYRDGDEDIRFGDGPSSTLDWEGDNTGIIQISPNPSVAQTIIHFSMKRGGQVDISLIDVNGQLVRQLRKGEFFDTGMNSIDFRAENLASGVYFVRIQGKDFDYTQRFVKN